VDHFFSVCKEILPQNLDTILIFQAATADLHKNRKLHTVLTSICRKTLGADFLFNLSSVSQGDIYANSGAFFTEIHLIFQKTTLGSHEFLMMDSAGA